MERVNNIKNAHILSDETCTVIGTSWSYIRRRNNNKAIKYVANASKMIKDNIKGRQTNGSLQECIKRGTISTSLIDYGAINQALVIANMNNEGKQIKDELDVTLRGFTVSSKKIKLENSVNDSEHKLSCTGTVLVEWSNSNEHRNNINKSKTKASAHDENIIDYECVSKSLKVLGASIDEANINTGKLAERKKAKMKNKVGEDIDLMCRNEFNLIRCLVSANIA